MQMVFPDQKWKCKISSQQPPDLAKIYSRRVMSKPLPSPLEVPNLSCQMYMAYGTSTQGNRQLRATSGPDLIGCCRAKEIWGFNTQWIRVVTLYIKEQLPARKRPGLNDLMQGWNYPVISQFNHNTSINYNSLINCPIDIPGMISLFLGVISQYIHMFPELNTEGTNTKPTSSCQ